MAKGKGGRPQPVQPKGKAAKVAARAAKTPNVGAPMMGGKRASSMVPGYGGRRG